MTRTDTTPEAELAQIEVYRRMSGEARVQAAMELSRMTRESFAEGIRARHPEYDEQQVAWAARRALLPEALFRAAYPDAPELDP